MTDRTIEQMRVRFAPSPTGELHIGSARTALFNWLYARHAAAAYVLRIEDTDRDRSTVLFEESIIEDLAWLGLAWDEGPGRDGDFGPYRQTERDAAGIYRQKAEKLAADGHAYHCFCLPDELEAERQTALAQGRMPKYSGKCRKLSVEEGRRLSATGRQPTVRFAVPAAGSVEFNDLIRGPMEFSADVLGDFILLRQNGAATYNFAVVVDDALMEITHVLRGEDHLTNTARQILIFKALGESPPRYGHFSMIFGADRTKLSKRHGATAIGDYRRRGFLAQAVLNYLALLSWSAPDGAEVLDLDVIAKEFSLERVSKSPAIFDEGKLRWLNGQHIRRLELGVLAMLVRPWLDDAYGGERISKALASGRLMPIIESVQTNIELLSDIVRETKVFIDPQISAEVRKQLTEGVAPTIRSAFADALSNRLELTKDGAREIIKTVGAELKDAGVKGKEIFQTVRLALTGELSGPEVFLLLYALGPEEAVRRLRI